MFSKRERLIRLILELLLLFSPLLFAFFAARSFGNYHPIFHSDKTIAYAMGLIGLMLALLSFVSFKTSSMSELSIYVITSMFLIIISIMGITAKTIAPDILLIALIILPTLTKILFLIMKKRMGEKYYIKRYILKLELKEFEMDIKGFMDFEMFILNIWQSRTLYELSNGEAEELLSAFNLENDIDKIETFFKTNITSNPVITDTMVVKVRVTN